MSSSGRMLDDPLGEDGDAVLPARGESLDDRPDEDIDDGAEPDLVAELLRDEGDGRPGGLADAEREVAGLAPHRDDEVPAPRRPGVDEQRLA